MRSKDPNYSPIFFKFGTYKHYFFHYVSSSSVCLIPIKCFEKSIPPSFGCIKCTYLFCLKYLHPINAF